MVLIFKMKMFEEIKATGILIETVVKEKDVDRFSANRGAGTFYHLKNEKIRKLKN